MNRIIIPTGYMGSGSSAITDLISEIEGYDADRGSFEYVFLHCPNGVFDLEDKLLIGNNALRSDEALHSFKAVMKQLYDKKYWWVGHYNVNMCTQFMQYTEEYINSLIQYKPSFYWYHQENTDFKMAVKLIEKKLVNLITLRKVSLPKPLLYNDVAMSYVTPNEFYEKTRVYLKKLWDSLGLDKRNLILDQLLLPHNLFRAQNYFADGEMKAFVVERDPRDVFIINKYIWAKNGGVVPYPIDAREFAGCYRRIRQMEKPTQYSGVYRIRFEDLVYDYDNSIEKLYSCLDVNTTAHKKKLTYFDPKRSVENTQLFRSDASYAEEGRIIAEELPEYLYDFPYERKPDCSKTF